MQQQISSTQIIKQNILKENPDADVDRVMQFLAYKIQKKEIKLLQIGNTVFLLTPKDDKTVEFHTFSIEPISDIVLRYRAGINTAKEMGFKKAVSHSDSAAFVKIAKQTGLPVHISREKTDDGKTTYKFEVDL
jgi:hypothetical protein